jgi:hypothetical protein
MQPLTLRVETRTQSVEGGVTTRSVGTINTAPRSAEMRSPVGARLAREAFALIVPTLCVGMQTLTLRVETRTRSVEGGVTTRSVGTISNRNHMNPHL